MIFIPKGDAMSRRHRIRERYRRIYFGRASVFRRRIENAVGCFMVTAFCVLFWAVVIVAIVAVFDFIKWAAS
jgi:hypothetical protein